MSGGQYMKSGFLSHVCLAVLLLSSATIWASEQSFLSLSPDVQRGDIYSPQGFWPLLGVGLGTMGAGDHIRTGGVPTHVKLLGSYYFEDAPWVADGGVGLHNEFLTQKGGGSDTVQSLYTELAARYQFTNRWQLGAIWNTLVDNPRRYHSNSGNLASFVGVQALKEFAWDSRYLVRAGGRAMTDVGISGEQISTVMAELEVSFGSPETPQIVETEPVIRSQPIAPHLDRQAMQSFPLEPGPVRFESDSTKVVHASEGYIRRLARALADNRQLFERVEVVGHADQRGTDVYNYKLSLQRAHSIANSLMAAGLNRQQIGILGKGKTEVLTQSMAPSALARNRRVELQFIGVKNQFALKSLLDSIR